MKNKSNIILKSVLVISLFISLIFRAHFFNGYANPITVYREYLEFGGLIPGNFSSYLSMSYASVFMDINAINHRNEFTLDFSANYTIYNSNETSNVLIGAPFYNFYDYYYYYIHDTDILLNSISETLKFIVNDVEVSSSLEHLTAENAEDWEEFLPKYYGSRLFVISNITLNGFSNNSLQYTWNSIIKKHPRSASTSFYYDVGTSRGWNGTITEFVKIKVLGRQPDYYSDYVEDHFSKNCIINSFEGGKIYNWEWIDERITDYFVGVTFDGDTYWQKNMIYFILFPLLLSPIIGYLIYLAVKRKKLFKKQAT
jgi:hypothetical protein